MRSIARRMVATLVLMGQARRSRALRSVCPTLRMVSSFGGGSGSGSSGGIGSGASGARSFQRDPTKVLEQGRIIAEDALSIAQEVGFGATLRRTIRAQQALLSTAVELSRELPLSAPPSPSSFPPSAATPQALVESYLETLPPELAPRVLRRLFERLGATYIKLGQFIASSPTIFPPEYVLEFQKCLDDTPGVDFDVIKDIVEKDLGKKLGDTYSSFDPTPLASASVAQVHAATLRDGNRDVVVKVQKPGVSDTLRADLGFLAVAGKVLEFLAPELSRLSLANVITDLRESMLGELDFRQEGKNLGEFREFLVANGLTDVATAPSFYPEASATKVLTMERLYGVPLVDLEGIKGYSSNPEQTLINALNTWTLSVVSCPFFHADVHAGNLLVLKDGRVGFIDFGIVGRIPPRVWNAIQELAVGFAASDWQAMAAALVQMGATDEDVDVRKFGEDLRRVVQSVEEITPQVMVQQSADGVSAAVAVDEAQVTQLALDLVAVAEGNGVKLPREFGVLVKQVLYFDRYTRLLAPELDVTQDQRLSVLNAQSDALNDAVDCMDI
jgi:aarF domain-containing kinase